MQWEVFQVVLILAQVAGDGQACNACASCQDGLDFGNPAIYPQMPKGAMEKRRRLGRDRVKGILDCGSGEAVHWSPPR
ncbi:hypothetical protein FB451DRAFT_1284155 [Mycena latifolia]|nr:hypothetical protein FB451DRAFT_1284155 [Mycena latifolia]